MKSGTLTRLTDEHLEASLRIATTSVKPDSEALIKSQQCQVFNRRQCDHSNFTFILFLMR
jgi:hypothetical protein